MFFWIFMLVMDLLIPFTMLGFGWYFLKRPPKEINSIFGYRTSMSMKNRDTWMFAHHYCGKLWYVCGLILLPLSVIPMLLVFGAAEDTVEAVGGIVCGLQMIFMIGSIIPTEAALRRTFDRNGRRR